MTGRSIATLPLARVFYVSEIVTPVSLVDIQVILGAAQVINRRLDVTGMLAQSDGHFAQVLEGRREAIQEVMARIGRNPRHRLIRVILQEPILRRQFDRWAMGLVRRDDMAVEMQRLHQAGAMAADEARTLIQRLLHMKET
jgi:hypothetical protein